MYIDIYRYIHIYALVHIGRSMQSALPRTCIARTRLQRPRRQSNWYAHIRVHSCMLPFIHACMRTRTTHTCAFMHASIHASIHYSYVHTYVPVQTHGMHEQAHVCTCE